MNDDHATSMIQQVNDSFGKTAPTPQISLREPKHGRTILHQHIRSGDVAFVEKLVRTIPSLLRIKDNHGNHALHFAVACKSGYTTATKLTRMLLATRPTDGSDHSIINEKGYTPLHVHLLTLKNDRIELLQALLVHGTDPDTPFILGFNDAVTTPLHYAIEKNYINVACTLVQHGATFTTRVVATLPPAVVTVPVKIRRQLIASIVNAPPLMSIWDTNTCVSCNAGPFRDLRLVPTTRTPLMTLKSVFSRRVKLVPYCHCYYCGMIYCQSKECIVPNGAFNADILPSSYYRESKMDGKMPTSPVAAGKLVKELCRTCEKLLTLRHDKSRKSVRFIGKSLGYDNEF